MHFRVCQQPVFSVESSWKPFLWEPTTAQNNSKSPFSKPDTFAMENALQPHGNPPQAEATCGLSAHESLAMLSQGLNENDS